MNAETLKKTLTALQQELSRARALDEESQRLLHEIMRDVEGLAKSPGSAPPTLHRHRLEELAVGFEIDHPRLAAGVRQLVDLLAQAGL